MEEDNFDPFNPIPKSKTSKDDNIKKSSDNDDIKILYITGGIILLVIFIWVIIMIMSKEDDKILDEMIKLNNQIKLTTD